MRDEACEAGFRTGDVERGDAGSADRRCEACAVMAVIASRPRNDPPFQAAKGLEIHDANLVGRRMIFSPDTCA